MASAPMPAAPAGASPDRPARWNRPLAWGIAASLAVHAGLLAVRFTPPQPRIAEVSPRLEVVLLNATARQRPHRAEVLAQASMVGGGDHDQGRARSPLAAADRVVDGVDTQRRPQQPAEPRDAQFRRSLLAAPSGEIAAPSLDARPLDPVAARANPTPPSDPAIERLATELARDLADYQKRPRRLTFGVNAVGATYARWVDDWARRVEKIGTERFPPEARGRLYDSLVVLVEIDRDGRVRDVRLIRKSRHEALNRAVRQIVHAGQPYARFSPEMAREGDILQIVRTWTFTRDALATSASVR